MTTILGYQPASGDTVRIIAASATHNQGYIGLTGVVVPDARGLHIDFHDLVTDVSLFGEMLGLKVAGIVFTGGDSTITLEQVTP